MRFGRSIPAGFTLLFSAALSLNAAPMHPVEQRLRDQFPSVPLQASATFDAAEEMVGRSVVSGLRAHFAQASAGPNLPGVAESMALVVGAAETNLQVTYPRFYGDPLVAALGEQRVVLRAVAARGAVAEAANGKLIYQQPYGSVDAVQVPSTGRSEELLLLRDDGAPLVYEYEIVEMSGVSAVVMDGGAVRFLSNASEIPSTTQIASGRFTQLPRMLQIDRPWVVDAAGRRSEVHAKWTVISDGKTPKTLRLTVSGKGLAYPLVVDPSFSVTGSLATARRQHTATLLPNGKVLIAGGLFGGYLTSAELYDPASGTFSVTGSLATARSQHTATLLPNGKVLIAGGYNGSSLTSAELYDPASGTFSATTGSLGTARYSHTATLLRNGKVLVAGGYGAGVSAELYDPASGTFSATGNLGNARYSDTATLLQNGKVLFAGGFAPAALSSAELYDPAGAGTFSGTGTLATARGQHTATLLANGKVLIAGGYNPTSGSPYLSSAALYDPTNGTFSATAGLGIARYCHTATLLPNGKVLIAGGFNGSYLSSSELYDPAIGTFSATTGSLGTARFQHTATLLPNGKVLIAGGFNGSYPSSAELYDPASGTFSGTGSLATQRTAHTATLLPSGKVLIAGGYGMSYLPSIELYDPASGTFSVTGSLVASVRDGHTATLLPNGKVLIAGGKFGGYLTSAELYDPVGGTFTATGSLGTARYQHTATLLPNGKVLIAGGFGDVGSLTSAELYDPASDTFSTTGSLGTARKLHTATLLPNGNVLIAGGVGDGELVTSAELYDPASGTFSVTGSLVIAREYHTATLLPNGKVLIAGGIGGSYLSSAELYDPASGVFSATTGSLSTARWDHTATLLPSGKVLMAGGLVSVGAYLLSAELYDPASSTFSVTGSLSAARTGHTATLLPNGKVLIAGGSAAGALLSAELYDTGLGYADARRPVVISAPATLVQPAAIVLSGSGFRGDSEASGGSPNSSPTNYPLLQLQRVGNDQTLFVSAGSAWSDTSFTSTSVRGLASDHYRLTIITNAIPSLQSLVSITGATTIANINPNGGPASGGQSVTITGISLSDASVTIGGNPATVTGTTATTATFTTPAHAVGAVDVTVTASGGSATAVGGYTYFALSTPSAFSATATSTSQVALSWSAVAGATSYEVWRSSLNGPYTPLPLSPTGTSENDSGLSADTTYLYKVRAIGGAGTSAFTPIDPATTIIFTDPSLSGVLIQAVHIAQLRTAVNAMRAAAGLLPAGFTDSTLTPGSTIIMRLHVTELRTALDTARSTLGLPAMSYTDPTITSGVTVMNAAHLTELRAGTQ
jgi:IPT/TIG domain/Galactose oxidase, central domain